MNQQGHLLVVDDDRMQRMILSRCLSQQGHTVQEASDGEAALQVLGRQLFDAVLLDVKMPGMDGFEVLERIMGDERLKQMPVIMVSGLEEMGGVVACIEMGAADYLHKPFDPSLLRARVQNCLQKKRSHDQEVLLRSELQEKYNQLSQLESLRDSLTDMIVHDLRTPLTALLTGLQTLPYMGEMNAEQHEVYALSLGGGENLLSMINDLLDVSKMESGSLRLERQPLCLPDLVEAAVRQVAPLARDKEIALSPHCAPNLPTLSADENKLARTLVNLLGNAVKFTPSQGAITLAATYVARPERTDSVVFSVSDSGEGIPREAFERIFEKFGQVEGRKSGRKMSSGLGLTFCKLAVEAHGGRIWVESELGQGSTFAFAIPSKARV